MAISLSDIKRSVKNPCYRMVIHGTPGIGKTTFASQLPSPIFIRAEDGLGGIEVDTFDLVTSYGDVIDAIGLLYAEEHDYKTVVLDTASALEPIIWQQVAIDERVKHIEDLGYGKGYVKATDLWRDVIGGLSALRDKGINSVVLAHSDVVTFHSPETEAYDRYQIKLHQRAFKLFYESFDIIGFANWKTSVLKSESAGAKTKSRGIGGGERKLYLEERPAFIAKNRYSLPASMPFDAASFLEAMTK